MTFTRMMAWLRSQFADECAICGTEDNLEFAHITPTPVARIPRGRGGNNRAYDIKRNPSAYRLLCRSCHLRYDVFTRQALRLQKAERWYLGSRVNS